MWGPSGTGSVPLHLSPTPDTAAALKPLCKFRKVEPVPRAQEFRLQFQGLPVRHVIRVVEGEQQPVPAPADVHHDQAPVDGYGGSADNCLSEIGSASCGVRRSQDV